MNKKEIINEWWVEKESDGKKAYVYTENLRIKEDEEFLMAEYFIGNKLFAMQYKYDFQSDAFKRIKNKLNLTEENRKKETKFREKRKEGE